MNWWRVEAPLYQGICPKGSDDRSSNPAISAGIGAMLVTDGEYVENNHAARENNAAMTGTVESMLPDGLISMRKLRNNHRSSN